MSALTADVHVSSSSSGSVVESWQTTALYSRDNERLRQEVVTLASALQVLHVQNNDVSCISLSSAVIRLQQYETEFAVMVSEVEGMVKQLHASEQKVDRLTQTVTALGEQLDVSQSVTDSLLQRNDTLSLHVQQMTGKYHDAVSEAGTLRSQCAAYGEVVQQVRLENDALQSELTDTTLGMLDVGQLQATIDEQQKQIHALQSQNEQLRSLKDGRISQLESQLLRISRAHTNELVQADLLTTTGTAGHVDHQ